MKTKVTAISIITVLIFTLFTACSPKEQPSEITTTQTNQITEEKTTEEQTTEQTTEEPKGPVTMNVICKSVTPENKLKTKCAAEYANGQNLVPEITWDPVENAQAYAVYMLDESANNWLHMMAVTTDTTIKEGESIKGQYIGPYPPSGTHNYTIYVLALENFPNSLPGAFNSTNPGIDELSQSLGTILGQGSTTVLYSNGDNNV